jgi:hypothetical protein
MELVEGPTLAERLARGPVPVDEALAIARQVADALETAHERRIIHRDLKPANLKVREDGTVKVLDFGLAKALDPLSAAGADASTMTIPDGTAVGAILGTPACMSPEQARGLAVDSRTDIWAFGCVLYEMLAGSAPFASGTVSDTLAKVLEREPDWSALPATTPPTVRRLLTRCLEKDLRRRLQHIGDARIELEDAASGVASASADGAKIDPRPARRLRWIAAGASLVALVALIAVAALAWYLRAAPQARPSPPRITRLTMVSSGAAAVAVTNGRRVALTPDGARVIYVGRDNQLFVHPLDRLDATAIFTGAAPLQYVFVSPDGQWVGFVEGPALKKVALTGGPVQKIVQSDRLIGATWAPDDTIVFAGSDPATGLRRVSSSGGAETVLTRPDPALGELDHIWPEMLPDGRGVLFTITAATGGLDAAQVAVLDLSTNRSTVLVRGGTDARYVPSGHLVYTSGSALLAVPFDLTRLETRGTPVAVLAKLARTTQGAGDFAVARDGTFVYVEAPDSVAAARTLVWVDRLGSEEALAAPPRSYIQPRLSPDGTRVAVTIEDQDTDIWVWDLALRTLAQLTFDPAGDFGPVWTPDGRRLVFFSQRAGEQGLFWQLADGTGTAESLGAGGPPSGVTPDGRQVISAGLGNRDLQILALDGTRRVQPLLQTPFVERNGIVSPDGHWLAYESDSSGRFEIYVRPFPDVSTGQWLISPAGGTRPLWAANGQELFYVAPGGALMAARVGPRGDAWSAGSPEEVLEGPYLTEGVRDRRSYDVSRDGRRFLMVKQAPEEQAATPQIIVVQNWLEELKRLVPTE